MSATPTTTPIQSGGEKRANLLTLLAQRDHAAMIGVGLVAAAFFAMFFRWFMKQFGPDGFSVNFPEDWAHAYVVPLISGYYIWRHRHDLLAAPVTTFWPGVVLIGCGITSYSFFVLAFPNHMFQGLAILVAVSGIVLLLAGPRVFGVLAFPIGYLALGVTISERVMNAITFRLKLLASLGSHHLLTLLGVEHDSAGNMLTIYDSAGTAHPLNVADACSGMRMVIAFIALAVAVAFLSCRHWWQRIALVLLAVPVALLMNVLRVAVLGILVLVNPNFSVGEAHMFIGTLLLIPAFAVFMGCVWALNQMVIEESGRTKKQAKKKPKKPNKKAVAS
jgi:exosortase